jgi:hypothetical protein
MWQVAGGRGKNEQKKAAEEMKRYAFAGLGVFDMADICEFVPLWDQAHRIVSVVDAFLYFAARSENCQYFKGMLKP